MNKWIKGILSFAVSGVIMLGILYLGLGKESASEEIIYVDVVVAKNEIIDGERIDSENLYTESVPENLADGLVQSVGDIEGKFADGTILKGQQIMEGQIKTYSEGVLSPDVREVRIRTNTAAYAGAGKGDYVDIIYVNRMDALSVVGKLIKEKVEVKAVLNTYGVDLEVVEDDKYNEVQTGAAFVVFEVDQELAIEIETLQGLSNDVVFRLAKWTDASDTQNSNYEVRTPEEIIFDTDTISLDTEDEAKTENVVIVENKEQGEAEE